MYYVALRHTSMFSWFAERFLVNIHKMSLTGAYVDFYFETSESISRSVGLDGVCYGLGFWHSMSVFLL